MDLYVANPISILSALLALGLLVLIAWTASQATRISRWGRRIAGLSLLGLLACMGGCLARRLPPVGASGGRFSASAWLIRA